MLAVLGHNDVHGLLNERLLMLRGLIPTGDVRLGGVVEHIALHQLAGGHAGSHHGTELDHVRGWDAELQKALKIEMKILGLHSDLNTLLMIEGFLQ